MLQKRKAASQDGRAEAAKAPAKAPVRPGVPSLISADVMIRGSIVSEGEIQFDGTIEGDLRAGGLVIGEGARVKGEVAAERVRVCGAVEGVVRARRVELAATAVVTGDVMHAALAVEDGARLDGKVCCMEDPVGRARALPTEKVAAELAEQAARRDGAATPPQDRTKRAA